MLSALAVAAFQQSLTVLFFLAVSILNGIERSVLPRLKWFPEYGLDAAILMSALLTSGVSWAGIPPPPPPPPPPPNYSILE